MSSGDIFGSSFEAFEREAAKTLAAMKRSASRAAEFERQMQTGATSRRSFDERVRTEVARDRVRGETIGETSRTRAAETKSTQETAAATERANKATEQRAAALKSEQAAQVALNREREKGNALAQAASRYGLAGVTGRQRALTRQYGPFSGGIAFDRELQAYQAQVQRQLASLGGQYGLTGGLPPAVAAGGGAGFYPLPGGLGPQGAAGAQRLLGPGPTRITDDLGPVFERYQKAQQAIAGMRQETSRLAQTQGTASQAMRRHGALTTEFIQSAARGEITMRELGFQVGSTIGKFGGWLAAGTAVYGVVGAMQALYRGAVGADEGVAKLDTVIKNLDRDSAINSIQKLSQEFNLPIADVAEAAYQMGKVFHDQNQAFEVARAILYSVKVGELDVATSTRYLTGIVNGFNLPARQMGVVFDQINAAQNRFGVTIGNTEAGLAKAAGTFRAAGGDFSYLLSIITTAQKVTGQTGDVIGTAVARSPNFLRQSSNQAVLREFGINASQDIDSIIEEAFKVSRKLGGEELQQLASAIFGPQYGARVGTPLLQNERLFRQVQRGTSPENAQGSASRELEKRLNGANEQLQQIITGFERLGANLVEGQFADVFGLALITLRETLDAANNILEAFNQLPEGVQRALAYFTQIALVVKGLQRLRLGESIAGPPGAPPPTGTRGFFSGTFGGGDALTARNVRTGWYTEAQQLEDRRAQLTTEIANAQRRADAFAQAQQEYERRAVVQAQTFGAQSEQYGAALSQAEAANDKAVQAQSHVVDLKVEEEANARRQLQIQDSLRATQTRLRDRIPIIGTGARDRQLRTLDEARRTGDYFPATGTTPTVVPPTTLDEQARRVGQQNAESVRAAGQVPQTLLVTTGTAVEELDREANRSGRDARETQTRAQRAGAIFNRILGGFGNALFAFFAVDLIGGFLTDIADGLGERTDAIIAGAKDAESAIQQRSRVAQEAASGNSFGDIFSDIINGNGIDPVGLLAGTPGTSAQQRIIAAQQEQANSLLQLQAQNEALRQGDAVPFRYAKDIEKDIKKIEDSDRSRQAIRRLLRQYDQELGNSMEAIGQGEGSLEEQRRRQRAAEQALQAAQASRASNSDFASRLAKLQQEQVDAQLQAATTSVGGPLGYNDRSARRASIAYRETVRRLGGSTNTDDIEALSQARDQFYSGIQDAVQAELDRALLLADSPQERNQAYEAAYRRLGDAFTRDSREAVRQQEERVRALRERAQSGQVQTRGGVVDAAPSKQLLQRLGVESEDLRKFRRDLQERRRYQRQIEAELKQQQFDEQAALRDARVDARSARTADPLRQAVIAIRESGRDIDDAISQYGRGSEQFFQALAARRQAIQSRIQAELSLFQARQDYSIAGIDPDNQQAQLQAQLANARAYLSRLQSYGNKVDPQDIIQAQTDIRNLETELASQTEQDAEDLKNAIFDIAKARADARGNEVASARIALQQARYQLRVADTPLERAQARQAIIQQRANLRDQVANRAIENVEYQADIHDWTAEREISAYRRLLSTLELTRDMRRDLKQKIAALKNESESDSGDFNLRVGDIRLPTIYDVRRAMQGGINSNPAMSVTNAPQINIYATGPSAGAAVASALDRTLGTGTRAAMRSAGIT